MPDDDDFVAEAERLRARGDTDGLIELVAVFIADALCTFAEMEMKADG